MYLEFFGLTRHPFLLTPDPGLLFASDGHRRALAYLEYGLHRSEGFVVITGEVGAGKTTVVRTMLGTVDPDKVVAVNVVSSQIDGGDLLRYLAQALQVAPGSDDKSSVLARIESQLYELHDRGQRALLVIDEAQNLSRHAIEELRMLSNFQVGPAPLLQVFLVGQPELRALMESGTMDQVRQRVIASCHLGALTLPETIAYIRHRLELSGWNGRPMFQKEVLFRLHDFTAGVPRRINMACDRLLLASFLSRSDTITLEAAEPVLAEMLGELGPLASSGQVAPTDPLLRRDAPRSNVVAIDDGRLLQRIAGLEERIAALASMHQQLVGAVAQLMGETERPIQGEVKPT
ncbi:MAG: XrtA/PEP-CTERM system-associated ATPase [Burkholderiaceae bacterium]